MRSCEVVLEALLLQRAEPGPSLGARSAPCVRTSALIGGRARTTMGRGKRHARRERGAGVGSTRARYRSPSPQQRAPQRFTHCGSSQAYTGAKSWLT